MFATLKDAKSGEAFTITQTKNDRGYWDWTSANPGTASDAPVRSSNPVFPASKSFETAEERAARQVLIVKQSSLAQAVASLGAGNDLKDYLTRASEFTAWVTSQEAVKLQDQLDDLPF